MSTSDPYTLQKSPAALQGAGFCLARKINATRPCDPSSKTDRAETSSRTPAHETHPSAARALIAASEF